jgi:hypothetical protein
MRCCDPRCCSLSCCVLPCTALFCYSQANPTYSTPVYEDKELPPGWFSPKAGEFVHGAGWRVNIRYDLLSRAHTTTRSRHAHFAARTHDLLSRAHTTTRSRHAHFAARAHAHSHIDAHVRTLCRTYAVWFSLLRVTAENITTNLYSVWPLHLFKGTRSSNLTPQDHLVMPTDCASFYTSWRSSLYVQASLVTRHMTLRCSLPPSGVLPSCHPT